MTKLAICLMLSALLFPFVMGMKATISILTGGRFDIFQPERALVKLLRAKRRR